MINWVIIWNIDRSERVFNEFHDLKLLINFISKHWIWIAFAYLHIYIEQLLLKSISNPLTRYQLNIPFQFGIHAGTCLCGRPKVIDTINVWIVEGKNLWQLSETEREITWVTNRPNRIFTKLIVFIGAIYDAWIQSALFLAGGNWTLFISAKWG